MRPESRHEWATCLGRFRSSPKAAELRLIQVIYACGVPASFAKCGQCQNFSILVGLYASYLEIEVHRDREPKPYCLLRSLNPVPVSGSSRNTWVFSVSKRSSTAHGFITPPVCQRGRSRIESKSSRWLSMKASRFLYSVSNTMELGSPTLCPGISNTAF